MSPELNAQADSLSLLEHCTFGLQCCFISYPFSNIQLTPGNKAQTVTIPHTGFRILFLGYHFNEWLSGELSLMRPIYWVGYNNMSGDHSNHTVWLTEGTATTKYRIPVLPNLYVDAEGGLGVVSRHGFQVNHVQVLSDANYATFLLGASLNLKVSSNFEILGSVNYSPASTANDQPTISAYALGFHYRIDTSITRHMEELAQSPIATPSSLILIGYTPHRMSYATNRFFTEGKVPLFFHGDVQVSDGYTLAYERNVFRSPGVFSLDGGADISTWTSSRNSTHFVGFSLFPVCKFALYRSPVFQFYFNYSAAGPSYISRTALDGHDIGKHFTFQDYMSVNTLIGTAKSLYAELRIAHYSNGNIFPENAGVDMPLTFFVGYTL